MAYKNIEDRKAYHRRWYAKNKARRVRQIREYHDRQIDKQRKYKLKKGCFICGYNKCAEAIDFHHKNEEEKEFQIAEMKGYSFERVLKEIKKCVPLCKNCHAEVHAGVAQIG